MLTVSVASQKKCQEPLPATSCNCGIHPACYPNELALSVGHAGGVNLDKVSTNACHRLPKPIKSRPTTSNITVKFVWRTYAQA